MQMHGKEESMIGLFVALGIAILTLLAILLWFVPHLLQQHEMRVATENAQLREIISEMLNEQEAVAMRQVQLGTSISYLQDQLEQIVTIGGAEGRSTRMLPAMDPEAIQLLEARMSGLQVQVDRYVTSSRKQNRRENEAWLHLIGLLDSIQERINTLSAERPVARTEKHREEHTNCRYNTNGNGNGIELTGQHLP
jgi:hypothetical protein